MSRYLITLRCPDVPPPRTDTPELSLPTALTSVAQIAATVLGAAAGAFLRIFDGQALVATAVAGGTGTDVITLDLTEGTHQFTATARSAGHTESLRSATRTLVVDRSAPVVTITVQSPCASTTVPLVVSAPGAIEFVVSQDATEPTSSDSRWGPAPTQLVLEGTPDAVTPVPTVVAPASVPQGNTFNLEVTIPQVPWVVHAWARDAAGNVGHASAEVTIAIPVTQPPTIGAVPATTVGGAFWLAVGVPQELGAESDPDASFMLFDTEGSSFNPILVLDTTTYPSAVADWYWSDGTHQTGATPIKTFAASKHRTHRLRVTPWAALRQVNVGYDAGDGGTNTIALHDPQSVSAIRNPQVATDAVAFAFSHNPMTSFDAHGMTKLQLVESFLNDTMKSVDVRGCPDLRRVCFENNSIEGTLDLRDSPLIEDVRGTMNHFTEILFAPEVPNLWHVCVQIVPTLARLPFERFTAVTQLWIDRSNQGGVIKPMNPDVTSLWLWNSPLTGVDLSAVRTNGILYEVRVADCGLNQAAVDDILVNLVRINCRIGLMVCDVGGTNAAPSATGLAAAATLRSWGWTVTTS